MHNLAIWMFLYMLVFNVYIVFGNLPPEYKMLLEYKKVKSLDKRIKIGKKIITTYPSAVFIDDLRILLARDLMKKGRKKEARDLKLP